MRSYSKPNDNDFSRRFWKGVLMAVLAGFAIAISLMLMGLLAYYGQKYGW